MASINSDIEEKAKDVKQMENVSPHSSEIKRESRNAMMILKEKLFDIKMIFESQWLRHGCSGNFERSRIYQIWPGKNVKYLLHLLLYF